MPFILSLFAILIFTPPVFPAQSQTLEKIVVRAGPDSLPAIEIITYPAESLNYICGMDLRRRGPFDIQADLSFRGSTYEQVGVLIDGINFMDPQTGHYNLDIPLTIFDIEKPELTKIGNSALSGPGALAGSVNFITKKPQKKAFSLHTLFGEHALSGQAFSLSFPGEFLSARISFDHKKSGAARANTDFKEMTGSLYLGHEFSGGAWDALLGYQKKDFGADSFYSNLFPEEEEHTETFLAKTSQSCGLQFGSLKTSLFLRKHRDKFILNRNNPVSVNHHTTYVYGLNSKLNLPFKYADVSLGLDTAEDEIYSTKLGKHTRSHWAGMLGFSPELTGRLTFKLDLRLDYYEHQNEQGSFNAQAAYKISERLKINAGIARAFRIPTFTELYYADAANIGNPSLKVEKSDNFTLGFDFKEEWFSLGLEGFYRRASDLIDWTRVSTSDPWQATNLGKVDFKGLEFSLRLRPHLNFKGLGLERITFTYAYTAADRKAAGFFSKYALDILKHQYLLGIENDIFGMSLNLELSYQQRYYGQKYFVGNVYLGKKIKFKDFTCEPFVKVDNFSNTGYSEVGGVLQPGRWVSSGLKFSW